MRRRHLLASATAIGLQALILPLMPRWTAASILPKRRVGPSDPQWPSAAAWSALDQEVGGHLVKVSPIFNSCDDERGGTQCTDAINNRRNPIFIGDQPGGTQLSGWLDAWTPAASVYAVAARNALDVAAAVNFARRNNLRLVVKGGGHSYQGTSSAPDSLLIWTRAMNKVVVHDAFVAYGCEKWQRPEPAATIDAGAMWIDAYDAVTTKAGRYVQGGGCTTVGVAGLIQGGGFGSFSKGFGMAAGSLLQAEIVTADGSVRTVNACSDPDLYWALKGGGGGSWGVVTKVTVRTHALPEFFGSANGTVQARTDQAFHRLVSRFVDFYGDLLFNPHWGEHVVMGTDNTMLFSMSCQGLDNGQAAGVWQPFIDLITADADLTVTDELGAGSASAQHWWDAVDRKRRGSHAMVPDPRAGSPQARAWWSGDQEQVGALLYGYESAWLPSSLLRPENRQKLADALFAASRIHEVELHFNKGLAGAPAEALKAAADTAMNPQVLGAFALAIIADGGPPAYPGLPGSSIDPAEGRNSRLNIARSMKQLYRVAPGAGSYVAESNYFEPAWQRSYWGKHYERLHEVKMKYDPEGLFFVHHGVGSEDWSADGFTRLKRG